MDKQIKNSVLIVDDEKSNIFALTHILGSEYRIFAERKSNNALKTAELNMPDVILLDILMPEMDGYSVIVELKSSEKTRNIPIIFISGLDDHGAEEKGLELGAVDYITKPFSPLVVKMRVRNQIKHISNYKYTQKLSDTLIRIAKTPAISSGELNAVANIVAKEACHSLNTRRVIIWGASAYTDVLMSISQYDAIGGELNKPDSFELSNSAELVGVLKSDRLIAINALDDAGFLQSIIETIFGKNDPEICAVIMSPVIIDDRITGLVYAEQTFCGEYPEKREWTIEERSFVSSIADLVALAVSTSERNKAREEAEQANKAKSSFLASMSHEIRTPMNAVLGITEILISHKMLPEEVVEGLSRIYGSCQLLLSLVDEILDLSKIEAGKVDIVSKQYESASLVYDSVVSNMRWIKDKPIEFSLCVDENMPTRLIGDEFRIRQILNNLLSNAFKYTDVGKVTLSVLAEPDPDGDGNGDGVTLVLSVQDTGLGIAKEDLGMLFEKYYRSSETISVVEGAGLGLAIVQQLVTLMGGDAHVESERGVGSLFVVRLPQKTVDSEVLGPEMAANLRQFHVNDILQRTYNNKILYEPMPYGHVLVVDDMEVNQYVAKGLMAPYGLKIDTAQSGYEAIEKVECCTYDIVFMDHMMANMNGVEATKFLREQGYTRTIVALTANAMAGQAEMFLANGFDDFISKPIDSLHMNAILNKYIRDKQPPEVIEAARKQAGQRNTDSGSGTTQGHDISGELKAAIVHDIEDALVVLKGMDMSGGGEDIQLYTTTVHGLKSGLANIGEAELSEFALKLEKAGSNGDMAMISAEIPGFVGALHAIAAKYKHPEQNTAARTSDEDKAFLLDKLNTLKTACEGFNANAAKTALAEIKQKTWSNGVNDALYKISDYLLCGKIKNAAYMAENILIKLR